MSIHSAVFNRGTPPPAFITELVEFGRTAPDEIFAHNDSIDDIYAAVGAELGPFPDLITRKAVMLEVMRVLAAFESSWNWKEGIDSTRVSADSSENSEAGAFQLSYDFRRLGADLQAACDRLGIHSGVEFQQVTKANHPFAMECVARLMRHTRKHNGPLYKGAERNVMSGAQKQADHSVYPWLNRDAVAEFQALITTS